MTADDLIRTANLAYSEGQYDLWKSAVWLLKTLHPDRLAPTSECQRDYDEYIEEMSLGGQIYKEPR